MEYDVEVKDTRLRALQMAHDTERLRTVGPLAGVIDPKKVLETAIIYEHFLNTGSLLVVEEK